MGNYTAEQIERRAKHFDNAGILDIAAMLRDYATLRQQAGRMDEAGYVFLCSNPACRAVHIRDPHGPCHVCLAGNGGGWSTTRQRLYRNGPDRYSTEEEGEAYMEGWFDGQAALAQNTQGDGEPVAWLIEWSDPTYRGPRSVSFDKCAPDSGKCRPLYLHAERARVPADLRDKLQSLAQQADAAFNLKGERHMAVTLETLADELTVLSAAPFQRAEVK